jgi:hypothetical protein
MKADDTKTADSAEDGDLSDIKPDAPGTLKAPAVAPHVAGHLDADSLQANLSAIASSQSGSLEVVGSAVGFANVSGDATLTASATPVVYAKGNVSVRQSYTSAVLAGGDMEITQAGAPIIVGKKIDVTQGGGCVLVSGESSVSNGFVGVLLTPKATISDDSKVLLSTRAAIIIAAALFGGLGLIALVMVLGVRRVMSWRPQITVPPMPTLPKLADLEEKWRHLRAG